ncbi:MAG: VOC family protein [Thermoleophilaceae bacterium]
MSARTPTHVGYAVSDLEAAARWWASVHGAGPFLALPPTPYDEVAHDGEPATLSHRLAFGQWGPIAIELQEYGTAEPSSLAEALIPPGGGINHVSYLVDDLGAEQVRLERHGLPELFSARSGPVELAYHAAAGLGHAIEVLQRNELLVDFYAEVERASRGWDGTEPLRAA